MPIRYTKHQVPRGTRADAEDPRGFYLFKNVSQMRATYQVRLLLYRAVQEGKKLTIDIPSGCRVSDDLTALARENKRYLAIVRV